MLVPTGRRRVTAAIPGVLLCAAAVGASYAITLPVPEISPLTVAVVLGVIAGNLRWPLDRFLPGLQWSARHLLRAGVVLLGLQLAIPEVLALGGPALAVVVAITTITFFGTQWLGRRFGVSRGTGLLVASGFAICGASAIAAVDGVTGNDEDEVVTAVALVTLFGSLAIVVLPLLQQPLGLSDVAFGAWAGASVHDVAQTVATASVVGPVALAPAVVVKLTRVVLLAPLVAGVGLHRRRTEPGTVGRRPPPIPLFVCGFLIMVGLRTTGWLPTDVLSAAQTLETILLAAALFGLGTAVNLRRLAATGGRAVLLGLCSWVLIATLAYVGVLIVH